MKQTKKVKKEKEIKQSGKKGKVILKFLIGTIVLLGIVIIGLLLYLSKIGLKSIPPKDEDRSYKIQTNHWKDRDVFVLTPKQGKTSELTILFVHGGAYALGIDREYWDFFDDLIEQTNCTIVVPDYPLAPKGTYLDVYEMMEVVYKQMAQKVKKENFIMIGDSAGGGIALGLAQKMGEENQMQPNQLILISPWLDTRLTNPQIEEVQKKDPMLWKDNLKALGELYATKEGRDNYLVNPIDGPLEKLENVTIFTGTYDILNPDVHVLEKRAQEEGKEITIKETEKASHIWVLRSHQNNVYHAKEDYEELMKLIKAN